MASWIHNQRTWMCLVFPTPCSGAHPDRCRRVRLDIDVDGSSHLLVHVLPEDSSFRATHDSVELCFSGTQGSHLIGCNPRIHKMSSVEFKSCMGAVPANLSNRMPWTTSIATSLLRTNGPSAVALSSSRSVFSHTTACRIAHWTCVC